MGRSAWGVRRGAHLAEHLGLPHQDEDEGEKSEGFWREFFLLRPDKASLKRMLDQIPPSEILELEEETRELFRRAVAALKSPHERAHGNALDVCGSASCHNLVRQSTD